MNAELLSKVHQNDEASVLDLLARGADSNCREPRTDVTPLHRAAIWGRANLISILLARGAHVDAVDNVFGYSPLMDAAAIGSVDSVRMLLAAGASIDKVNFEGRTALHLATAYNFGAVVDVLLAHNASPDIPDAEGKTPLHTAASYYHERLTAIKPNASRTDEPHNHSCAALDDAPGGGHSAIFSALLKHSSHPAMRDNNGNTPLHLAATDGYHNAVCQLLAVTERDITNDMGRTPLHLAAEKGHLAVINVLLKHGFQPDCQSIRGDTPMHRAIAYKRFEAVQAILAATPKPGVVNGHADTALHLAVDRGFVDIAKTLLINGTAPNARSPDNGRTALHHAAASMHSDCIDLLLANGGGTNIKDAGGRTPLAIAKVKGNASIINKLASPPPRCLQPLSLQKICRALIRTRLADNHPRQPLSASIDRLDFLPRNVRDYLYSSFAF